MTEEEFRTYKLPLKTCRQLDYLSLVHHEKKTEIVSNAVNLYYLIQTIIPDEIKELITQIPTESDTELFEMMRDYLLTIINEPLVKEAL